MIMVMLENYLEQCEGRGFIYSFKVCFALLCLLVAQKEGWKVVVSFRDCQNCALFQLFSELSFSVACVQSAVRG